VNAKCQTIFNSVIDIERDDPTRVIDLLRGFFCRWHDRFPSEGKMTEFIYRGVHLKAWRDSQNERKSLRRIVDLEVWLAWGVAEVLLAHLDAVVCAFPHGGLPLSDGEPAHPHRDSYTFPDRDFVFAKTGGRKQGSDNFLRGFKPSKSPSRRRATNSSEAQL